MLKKHSLVKKNNDTLKKKAYPLFKKKYRKNSLFKNGFHYIQKLKKKTFIENPKHRFFVLLIKQVTHLNCSFCGCGGLWFNYPKPGGNIFFFLFAKSSPESEKNVKKLIT